MDGDFGGAGSAGGRRLPWFWDGNTSIPCRGFGAGFSVLAFLSKMTNPAQNLCMGWGLVADLSFLVKMTKTRCVSDDR